MIVKGLIVKLLAFVYKDLNSRRQFSVESSELLAIYITLQVSTQAFFARGASKIGIRHA
jgi:hypothetical protein